MYQTKTIRNYSQGKREGEEMSQSLTGASKVPDVAWRYWGCVEFMKSYPGLYGADEQRTKAHERLCEHYKITKEQSKKITDNLDKYPDAVAMHFALINEREKHKDL
jgi:hypothetical protein